MPKADAVEIPPEAPYHIRGDLPAADEFEKRNGERAIALEMAGGPVPKIIGLGDAAAAVFAPPKVDPPKPKDNRTRVVSVRRVSFLHPVRLEKRPHTAWPEEPKKGPVEVTLQPFGVEVAGSLIPWANVAQVDYA